MDFLTPQFITFLVDAGITTVERITTAIHNANDRGQISDSVQADLLVFIETELRRDIFGE